MDPANVFAGKLSTINEVTESTDAAFHAALNESRGSNASLNASQLNVHDTLDDECSKLVDAMIKTSIVPHLKKIIQKICKRCKIESEEETKKLNEIAGQLANECSELFSQRFDCIVEENSELQSMLNTITDMSVELTTDPDLQAQLVPIRQRYLSKLTNLNDHISQTLGKNNHSLTLKEIELHEKEQESKSERKQLFDKLDAMNRMNPGLMESIE